MQILPNKEGFCIFKAEGQYQEDGRSKVAFRIGDVYARHGSASEHWRQHDIDKIRRNLKRREDEVGRSHVLSVALPRSRGIVHRAIDLLDPQHVVLVTKIEQCSYFAFLDRGIAPSNQSFLPLANSIWEYLKAVRDLDAYLETISPTPPEESYRFESAAEVARFGS